MQENILPPLEVTHLLLYLAVKHFPDLGRTFSRYLIEPEECRSLDTEAALLNQRFDKDADKNARFERFQVLDSPAKRRRISRVELDRLVTQYAKAAISKLRQIPRLGKKTEVSTLVSILTIVRS